MSKTLIRRSAAGVAALVVLLGTWKGPRLSQLFYHHGLTLVAVATGLDVPWSLAFLPGGRMLVCERSGSLRMVGPGGGRGAAVTGLPPFWSTGVERLFSIVIDPRFVQNHLVYWTYVEPAPGEPGRGGLAVGRGRLENTSLRDVRVIFSDPEKLTAEGGYGARLQFAPDGRLFVTMGDRTRRDDAQRLDSAHGKILRIESDGRIPGDNPFVTTPGAQPAIWALGFRDPQGLAFEPGTGRLWVADHGPLGGDELNLVERGHNYGWPVVTYGVEEGTGDKIGEGTEKAGMDSPAIQWGPKGVPPTGMTFLTSDRYPEWQGQLFIGTLWGQAMIRVSTDGTRASDQQHMFTGRFERVRDVRQGPDGWLYVVTNTPGGTIIRLER